MDLGINGKIAIVTGASEGLGFASALALADEGCSVVICSRRKRSIESAAKEISRVTKGVALPVVADISKPADVKRVVDTTVKEFGTVNILVNNTGGPPIGDFERLTDAKWEEGFQLVLLSMIRFVRLVVPLMIKESWGRVVTISSIAAKQPIEDLVISSTLRPGIHALNKILTKKYASKNILFNAVAPGYILTKRQEELLQSRASHHGTSIYEQVKTITSNVPAMRMGKPEELAAAVVFLASAKAAYISGSTVSVDGGLSTGLF